MRPPRVLSLVLLSAAFLATPARSDDPPADGPLTRVLKKAPPERRGPVIDMIGKRGSARDLDYLFEQALLPDAFAPETRLKAFDALDESARTRGTIPSGNPARLANLIDDKGGKAGPRLRLAAVKLAGLWKVRGLIPALRGLAGSKETDEALRAAAFDALAQVGGDDARQAVASLSAPEVSPAVRMLAIGALVRFDVDDAADRAGAFLGNPGGLSDITPLIAAFLNKQGGADKLAAVLGKTKLPVEPARMALSAVFALGRSDPSLVNTLSRAAGLDAEVKPLDKAAMDKVVADVAAKGDAERGERLFRRPDLNCMRCHALSAAGGGVGPDLSALGSSSPVDYVVNSIMLPDQAIKEEFQTLVIQTVDGQVFQGIVADKDDKRVVLKEATGALRTVPTDDIDASKEGGSLMPKGLVNFVTRNEFLDLVRFLSELGKPGPYAIRSTPTIQRWRALKTPPDSLPDADAFRRADASRWLPAYAKLAGDLPLDEVKAATGSAIPYLQGEVEVSAGGPVSIKVNHPEGLTAWVDAEPAQAFNGTAFPADLAPGRHTITFRVDTAARPASTLRVEVLKPSGSAAEYSVVGGR